MTSTSNISHIFLTKDGTCSKFIIKTKTKRYSFYSTSVPYYQHIPYTVFYMH